MRSPMDIGVVKNHINKGEYKKKIHFGHGRLNDDGMKTIRPVLKLLF